MIHYTRSPDGAWQRRDMTDPGSSLALESICELSMRDIYESVTFPA